MFGAILDAAQLARLAALAGLTARNLDNKNEDIGQKVIDEADPGPVKVGSGAGATPKVVASPFQARVEAGGPWRAHHVPQAQWGAEWAPRDGERPYIVRAAEANIGHVEDEYLDAVADASMALGFTFIKGV